MTALSPKKFYTDLSCPLEICIFQFKVQGQIYCLIWVKHKKDSKFAFIDFLILNKFMLN